MYYGINAHVEILGGKILAVTLGPTYEEKWAWVGDLEGYVQWVMMCYRLGSPHEILEALNPLFNCTQTQDNHQKKWANNT